MSRPHLSVIQEDFFRALRRESNSLRNLIEPIGALSSEQCIDIYAKGYSVRLIEALGETYEATWWCLGDESFFALAEEFIRNNISGTFDLSDYGENFPKFLGTRKSVHEIEFLEDLARFEWTFKGIFHKPNMIPASDLSSRVRPDGSDTLKLNFSATLFESPYSAYEIWKKRGQPASEMGGFDWSTPEFLVVFRKHSKVFVHSFDAKEFFLIKLLSFGHSIADALSRAGETVNILPEQVQSAFSQMGKLGLFEITSDDNAS